MSAHPESLALTYRLARAHLDGESLTIPAAMIPEVLTDTTDLLLRLIRHLADKQGITPEALLDRLELSHRDLVS